MLQAGKWSRVIERQATSEDYVCALESCDILREDETYEKKKRTVKQARRR